MKQGDGFGKGTLKNRAPLSSRAESIHESSSQFLAVVFPFKRLYERKLKKRKFREFLARTEFKNTI